jgi:hypothetical protein
MASPRGALAARATLPRGWPQGLSKQIACHRAAPRRLSFATLVNRQVAEDAKLQRPFFRVCGGLAVHSHETLGIGASVAG